MSSPCRRGRAPGRLSDNAWLTPLYGCLIPCTMEEAPGVVSLPGPVRVVVLGTSQRSTDPGARLRPLCVAGVRVSLGVQLVAEWELGSVFRVRRRCVQRPSVWSFIRENDVCGFGELVRLVGR